MDESTTRSRHPDSLRQAFLWALLPTLVLFLITPAVGEAQVATNITSSGLGTVVQPPSDGVYNITEGSRPGGGLNLFHSFGDFSVGQGDIANFLNDSGLPTSNIIGRVTELGVAHTSYIDGTIQTTGFDVDGLPTNLFLVNPSGFVFGPNGSLNVTGSVSFTTAQYLRLSDADGVNSANFYADPANDGLANSILVVDPVVNFGFLSSAAPAAYGFLTPPDPSATITVQGSVLQVPITLDPVTGQPKGSTLSLVGGEINIGADPDTGTPATLMAPSGQINLVSVTSPGEILFPGLATGLNINKVPVTTMGTVTLKEGAFLDVSGQLDEFGTPIGNGNSGTVFVRGGQLVMDASVIFADTVGPVDVAHTAVDIQVSQDATLTNGAAIFVTTSGSGRGGDVQMSAANISLDGGAAIISDASGLGQGGNVQMSAANISLDGGAAIFSAASGLGQGGNVQMSAGNISLDGGAAIFSVASGLGPGGNVTLQGLPVAGSAADPPSAATTVTLSNGALIQTQTSGPGRGGDVHITADSLTLENGSFIITANSELGLVGGDISLNVGELHLLGDPLFGSQILSINSTGTDLDGNAVTGVGGKISVQGIEGAGSVADKVEISGGSGIVSETRNTSGDGGRISITANSLDLLGEASIVKSITSVTGTDLNGDGVVDAGRGGDIEVAVQHLSVLDGAAIRSSTNSESPGAADGGMVTIQGLDGPESMASSVLLSGSNTGITTDSASGVPGNLTVNAGILTITNGAVISTGTALSGPTGQVTVTADSIVISAGGKIFSQSFAQDAGKVTITANNDLTLDNGSIKTSTFGSGLGGNVELNGGTVSLTNGASINSQSEKFSTGRAGNITITGENLTLANHSEITSSSKGTVPNAGDAGTITITTTGNTVSLASSSNITSSTTGPGNAGQVIVTTPALSLNDATITTSTSSSGNAGGITANVGTLSLANAAEIASSSTGTMSDAGDAGSVNIKASGSFTSNRSRVSTSAENARGGDILIDAQNVQLSNGTLISANSNAPLLPDGAGNAGNITITSDSNVVIQNSSVTTEASHASGGSIEIDASDAGMIQLVNSQVSTSVGGSVGVLGASDGGNIKIDPQFVILQNSQIIAQAFAGAGGAIDITAGVFLADPASIVDASSTLGVSGTVNIESPVQNIGGRLTPLSQQFSSAAALLAQRCAARVADGKFSTFVVAGREGLPVEPGGFLASPSLTAELFGSSLSGRDRPTQFPAVTGLFPDYDARPIQLAKFGDVCHQ